MHLDAQAVHFWGNQHLNLVIKLNFRTQFKKHLLVQLKIKTQALSSKAQK
jgi:hypothetical protein